MPKVAKPKKPARTPQVLIGIDERLRKARDDAGIESANQLDALANISRGRTARIERRERLSNVSAETIAKLAQALNRSADYLLTGKEMLGIPLHKRAGWSRAFATAFSKYATAAPEWAWDHVGEVCVPGTVKLTPELVRDCVAILALHDAAAEDSGIIARPQG